MTSKALRKKLDELHLLTTQQLTEIIQKGVPQFAKDTGDLIGYLPAPPAYFAAAISLLRANGVEAAPDDTKTTELRDALKALPFPVRPEDTADDRLN